MDRRKFLSAMGGTAAVAWLPATAFAQRTEGRYLLETMCIGGGQGLAAVFERA